MTIKTAKCKNCGGMISTEDVPGQKLLWRHDKNGLIDCWSVGSYQRQPHRIMDRATPLPLKCDFCGEEYDWDRGIHTRTRLPGCSAVRPSSESPSLIYLASPYTHHDPAIKSYRLKKAQEMNAKLCCLGLLCYSPIAHTGSMAQLPTTWEFWEKFDTAMINVCSDFWVLTLDGWKESRGVQAELAIAKRLSKPILFISEEGAAEEAAARSKASNTPVGVKGE